MSKNILSKDINFFKVSEERRNPKKPVLQRTSTLLIIVAVLVGINLIVYLAGMFAELHFNSSAERAQEYLNRDTTLAKIAEMEEMKRTSEVVGAYQNITDTLLATLYAEDKEIIFSTKYYDYLLGVKPSTVLLTNVSYTQNSMVTTGLAPEENQLADLVKSLDTSELFLDVMYEGFVAATGGVTFTITCTIE